MSSIASYNIDQKSVVDRRKEYEKLREKYPNRVAILISKAKRSKLDQIDREKYLINEDMTVGQLVFFIRKRLKCSPSEAIFLFINGSIPSNTQLIKDIYEQYKSPDDGFVRIVYSEENTFGCV